jgi:protein-tyrosine-phosphatase
MLLKAVLRALWKDPVGSNVLAAVIFGVISYLVILLVAHVSPTSFFTWTVARVFLPLAVVLVVLLAWHYFRSSSKTLVFLSAGGTCRDPMAKAIFSELLKARRPKFRIHIYAAGRGPEIGKQTSFAARYVIREMFGKDLLKNHEPQFFTPALMRQADLILVMDESLLLTQDESRQRKKTLPDGKTFLLSEFVGSRGDVVDPWPDGKDDLTIGRYRSCAEQLRTLLNSGMERIVRTLEAS